MTIVVVFLAFILVAVLWSRPRLLVVAALVAVLFVRTVVHLSGQQALDNIDDLLIVGLVVRAIQARLLDAPPQGGRPKFPGMGWFLAFAVLGLLGFLVHGNSAFSTVASGAFLAMKGVLLGWSAAQFSWPDYAIRRFVERAAPVVVVAAILALISFVIPSNWAAVFSVNGGTIDRYGLASALGPFIHPFDLAYFAAMAAVAAAAWLTVWGSTRWVASAAVGGVISTFLSFRRKDLLGLLVALAVITLIRRRWILLTFFVILLPVAITVAFDEISTEVHSLVDAYFAPESREARTVLTEGAVRIAADYFPLGAGFGRFASRTAAVDYSPEYFRLGLNTVYGLGPGPEQGAFLTDTSWPAVIGEAGWIGSVCFLAGLISIGFAFIKAARDVRPMSLFLGVTGIAWLILTLFQSTGSAVFTAPPLYAAFFLLAGIVGSRSKASEEALSEFNRATAESVKKPLWRT